MASRVHHGPVMARGLHGDPGGSGQVSVAEHEKQDFFFNEGYMEEIIEELYEEK